MTENGDAATRRLFFALWPPAELAAGLDAIASAAAQRFGGKASRREKLHLTLAFLGEQSVAILPALHDAARRVAAAPFDLVVDRLGLWRHNRLLWAGCAPSPGLDALAAQLGAALASAGITWTERQRAFKPHLTLARKLPAATPAAEITAISCAGLPAWPCTRFVLAASQPSAAGSLYSPLAEFPLTAVVAK
ncbi:MAG: RNA 2',3'-cyclic phosphodiesterase [Betaproteobacteria bacterium]|nr:RNA 2',3'-cyclic phosphodiesterase [Betaproteobacteria bacterium]MCL2886029.1 RNA 2',3'-cyclic phosphodiesterase [Betaproteobacteria bacterium]